jgi:hypothetical protein
MPPLALNSPDRPLLSVDEILGKCSYFTRAQLWPISNQLAPRAWLANFRSSEEEYAVHLLNAFSYFSSTLVRQMFASSFQNLSRTIASGSGPFITLASNWHRFVDDCIVTYVTGEVESPTDSGFIFARLCRDYLGIEESQILSPADAIKTLVRSGPRPVIFVDDFIGSGNQFITTWQRAYPCNGSSQSFESLASILPIPFFYVSIFATAVGASSIRSSCPGVHLSLANELDERYSLLHPDCPFWPQRLRATAANVIKEVSLRAGIPDENGASVDDWQGFHKLGLALGFEHGIPDATLAIFRWRSHNWVPLRRQS